MVIIDTHLHFWKLSNNINSWVLKQYNKNLQKDYLPTELVKYLKGKLVGIVHVEAHDYTISTIKEIKWLQQEMRKVPIPYKHVAFIDITLPQQQFKNKINQIKDIPNVIGIRHILAHNPKFNYNPNDIDISSNVNIKANLKYLANNNLIYACQVYSNQMYNILPAIVDSGVITIVDHALLPAWHEHNDDDSKLWQKTISSIAKFENIYLKLSGIDMFHHKLEFDFIITHCLEKLPMARLLYGSNYPVSFNPDYIEWYNYLDNLKLSQPEKELLFFKNATKIFQFEEVVV